MLDRNELQKLWDVRTSFRARLSAILPYCVRVAVRLQDLSSKLQVASMPPTVL